MNLGDLILFVWPEKWSRVEDPFSWEHARIGVIIGVLAARPNDKIGDELLVLHEGERWSIPRAWCRPIEWARANPEDVGMMEPQGDK